MSTYLRDESTGRLLPVRLVKAGPPASAGKAIGSVEPDGRIVARFATLNVKDLDGDVTVRGAFPSGKTVPMSAYNHTSWQGALPVGLGTIAEEGDHAIFRGKLWLDTAAGAETYKVLKHLGGTAQYSYGYRVLKSHAGKHDGEYVRFLDALDVHEVSAVLVGAGIHTGTVALSSVDAAHLMIERAVRENDAALRTLRHPHSTRVHALLRQARALGVPIGATSGRK